MSDRFPKRALTGSRVKVNPAVHLFGLRFFGDQSVAELLVEFLLVAMSAKRIGREPCEEVFPTYKRLGDWQAEDTIEYAPRARLNLKLFSFIGASKLEARHEVHRRHYEELVERLGRRIRLAPSISTDDVLRTLENLFLGFHGAGGNRIWCTQSFLPVCPGVLACEANWNTSSNVEEWEDALGGAEDAFSFNKHLFLARGGELLYMQVCNAFRQPEARIREWASDSRLNLEPEELDPARLHERLGTALTRVMEECPASVSELADFLDHGVEPDTAERTDFMDGQPRFTGCGWCPEESWPEGYLFAVELARLCEAQLGIMDRLELLEIACAMQELRSLGAQSARLICPGMPFPGYLLAVSDPEGSQEVVKRISQGTAKHIEKTIFQAIRSDAVRIQDPKDLRQADRKYAGKLYLSVAKRIGFMVPRRGRGARFVLTDRILRYLVLTVVPAGGRLRYDRFKELVEARHGLVFDGDALGRASSWTGGATWEFYGSSTDQWLQGMLEAAGTLRRLSDSCALVENPVVTSAGKMGEHQP
jgi:hypothetical protein